MHSIKKFIPNLFLTLGLIFLFPLGIYYLFGLSGSNPGPILAMLICHLIFLVFSFLGRKRPIFFVGSIFGILGFIVSYQADKKFWSDHNQMLCQELKSDPYCQKSPAGFTCQEPSKLGNFSAGIGVCQ